MPVSLPRPRTRNSFLREARETLLSHGVVHRPVIEMFADLLYRAYADGAHYAFEEVENCLTRLRHESGDDGKSYGMKKALVKLELGIK